MNEREWRDAWAKYFDARAQKSLRNSLEYPEYAEGWRTKAIAEREAAYLLRGDESLASLMSGLNEPGVSKGGDETQYDFPTAPLRDHLLNLSNGGLCVRCGESGHRIQSHPDMVCIKRGN